MGNILLAPLVENICNLGGFDFSEQTVEYYSEADKCFVLAGKHPVGPDEFIDKNDISSNGPLVIKMSRPRTFRQPVKEEKPAGEK